MSMPLAGLLQALSPRIQLIERALRGDAERIRAAWGASAADSAQVAVLDALCDLLVRPAKRVRSALMCAVAEAFGEPWSEAVSELAVALEWLQVYLLIHDDWMDHDDTRRGGPSVPAMMREAFPAHADAAAVLAGDLAHAFAQQALARALRAGAPEEACEAFARMHAEVVLGQLSDVLVAGESLAQVELRYAQKTASYTTVGPMRLGAMFGASSGDQERVADAANALGIAFQIRDDLMGVSRDEREEKNTWLRVCGFTRTEPLKAADLRIYALVTHARERMPAPLLDGPGSDAICALCMYLLKGT